MPSDASDDGFLLALHDHWERKRAGRAMPDRADIDPVELPRALLPYLFIVEYAKDCGRWRYRLMGTEMVERLRADLTGRYLDEALGGRYSNYLVPLNTQIRASGCPIYTESTLTTRDGGVLLTKRMLVPLTRGGTEVAMILGAQTYHGAQFAPSHSLVLTDGGAIAEVRRRLMAA